MILKRLMRGAADRIGVTEIYLHYLEWRLIRNREKPPRLDEHGAPIPPLALMARVAGHADWRVFLSSGAQMAKSLDMHAAEAGLGFAQANRILDFGCGCGRIIRHLPQLTAASLFGVDYSRQLTNWCAENLKGEFSRNHLRPPLHFPGEYFDVVYLLSVFTHLRIAAQREWLAELARITRLGGLVLVTVHDEYHPGLPDTDEARKALNESGVYIRNNMAEGSNFMATFQTQDFTRALMAEYFDVVRIIPYEETPMRQTLVVLKKRNLGQAA